MGHLALPIVYVHLLTILSVGSALTAAGRVGGWVWGLVDVCLPCSRKGVGRLQSQCLDSTVAMWNQSSGVNVLVELPFGRREALDIVGRGAFLCYTCAPRVSMAPRAQEREVIYRRPCCHPDP